MRRIATSCVLVVALIVAAAFAIPASYEREKESDTSDDAEFIVVPLSHQRPTYFNRYPATFDGFDGVVDTGDFAPVPARPLYFPSYNPFSWHLSGYLDDLMKRVRDRFAGSWNPFYGGDFIPSGPGVWPADIPDDSSEDAPTNSTSTVKVIDGHKVVINDTYYTKKTDFGTSIFKVRVIDVKPIDETTSGEESPKPDTPTEVEVNNRNGEEEDEVPKPSSSTTEAPKRDTELESSDEEKATSDDEKLNTIDTSNVDIDEEKPKEKEALTEQSESSVQWAGLESFEGASLDSMAQQKEQLAQRSREHSELLDSSSEEDEFSRAKESRSPLSDEWAQAEEDSRKRIIVPSRPYEQRFSANQQRPAADEGVAPVVYDLTNDIDINFRLATDRSVTANPNAITFDPQAPPTVVVQRDPFPAGPGAGSQFPGAAGRPTGGFPPQQPGANGPAFPMVGPFPGFPAGGQFPVQPFPIQPTLFGGPGGPAGGVGHPNFGFPPNPQMPPFFFGNGGQFGRP